MKFETFDRLITAAIKQLDADTQKEELLTQVFGTPERISLRNELVEEVIDSVATEFDVPTDVFDILMENVMNPEAVTFKYSGRVYEFTNRNLYDMLTGVLDE